MDPISGAVTHLGGVKLPVPIPMQKWAEANQEYAKIALDYIEATYRAQDAFQQAAAKSDIMKLVKKHNGKEILERLQEEKGFSLVIVNPTEKWEEPDYVEPKAEGLVDLENLRRIEIVAIATKMLKKKINYSKSKKKEVSKNQTVRRALAIPLAQLRNEVEKQLTFETTTNTRVKGVKGSDINWTTSNVGEFYLDAIADILIQEGWKSYTTEECYIPEVTSHPFWEAYQ